VPLSDYEREVLAQMERALRSDDPDLATSLRGEQQASGGIGRWLLGGAAILAGLIVLVVAVAIAQPWVGVIGFLIMFAGAWWAISKPKSNPNLSVVGPDGRPRPAGGKKPQKRGGPTFMERLEERWDRREDI